MFFLPSRAPYNPFAAKPVQKTTMAPTRRPAQKRPEPERRSAPPPKVKRTPKAAPKKEVYEEPEEEESPEIEQYATQMEVDEEEDDTEIEDASQAGKNKNGRKEILFLCTCGWLYKKLLFPYSLNCLR